MKITVRYFASLREALGSGEEIELKEPLSLGALRDLLMARGDAYAEALSRSRALRCALDKVMAEEQAVVQAGAEVAFFPPVTGG